MHGREYSRDLWLFSLCHVSSPKVGIRPVCSGKPPGSLDARATLGEGG